MLCNQVRTSRYCPRVFRINGHGYPEAPNRIGQTIRHHANVNSLLAAPLPFLFVGESKRVKPCDKNCRDSISSVDRTPIRKLLDLAYTAISWLLFCGKILTPQVLYARRTGMHARCWQERKFLYDARENRKANRHGDYNRKSAGAEQALHFAIKLLAPTSDSE